MTDKLKDRAARCVTHHAACDCREYAYRERIERLEGALAWYSGRVMYMTDKGPKAKYCRRDLENDKGKLAREALADEGTGGIERHQWDRDGERCVKCGAKDWMDAPCHPPKGTLPANDARGEACPDCGSDGLYWSLSVTTSGKITDGRLRLSDVEPLLVQSCARCSATVRVLSGGEVNRALTAPPTVPEAVRRLPEKWQRELELEMHARGVTTSMWTPREIEFVRRFRNDLIRALARTQSQQGGEAGRGEVCPVCETGTLTRVECCICSNCDATPVLTDQIRRNDKRLAARSGRIPGGYSEKLWAVHSALSDALGDSDVDWIESDEELRTEEPVQWAAKEIANMLAPAPDADELDRALAQHSEPENDDAD